MGQHIHFMSMEGNSQTVSETMELQRHAMHEKRQRRFVEIQAELQRMTVSDLMTAVLEAQTGRVETYREYNE